MSEKMSWTEIRDKYPNQWLGLVDIDWDNGATVKAAVIKYIGKNSDELLRIKLTEEPDLLVEYTSPDQLGPMGFIGGLL
ncbi:MAG: hypothetical protein IJ733_08995 [Lachnospiraceae bacterium]|nr:hypothetical protein [Lachnospiraceae bacterium]